MSNAWTWHYNPDVVYVTKGLPSEAIAEVERLAEELTILGPDAAVAGDGPAHGGGLRSLDLFGGEGLFLYLAPPGMDVISIVQIVWPH